MHKIRRKEGEAEVQKLDGKETRVSGQHSAEKKNQKVTKVETEHRINSSNTKKKSEGESIGEN